MHGCKLSSRFFGFFWALLSYLSLCNWFPRNSHTITWRKAMETHLLPFQAPNSSIKWTKQSRDLISSQQGKHGSMFCSYVFEVEVKIWICKMNRWRICFDSWIYVLYLKFISSRVYIIKDLWFILEFMDFWYGYGC